MIRVFKKINVVKMTESAEKAAELLAQGFQEITEAAALVKKTRTPKGGKGKENDADKAEENEKSDANESEGGTDGEFAEVESAAKS